MRRLRNAFPFDGQIFKVGQMLGMGTLFGPMVSVMMVSEDAIK